MTELNAIVQLILWATTLLVVIISPFPFTFLMQSHVYPITPAYSGAIKYLDNNLNAYKIIDLQFQTKCPNNYIAQSLMKWQGTTEGCVCSNSTGVSTTLDLKCSASCSVLGQTEEASFKYLNSKQFCVKVISSNYNYACNNKDIKCPITNITIMSNLAIKAFNESQALINENSNQNSATVNSAVIAKNTTSVNVDYSYVDIGLIDFELQLKRDITEQPIVGISINLDQPCFSYNQNTIISTKFPFLLLKYQNCTPYGRDNDTQLIGQIPVLYSNFLSNNLVEADMEQMSVQLPQFVVNSNISLYQQKMITVLPTCQQFSPFKITQLYTYAQMILRIGFIYYMISISLVGVIIIYCIISLAINKGFILYTKQTIILVIITQALFAVTLTQGLIIMILGNKLSSYISYFQQFNALSCFDQIQINTLFVNYNFIFSSETMIYVLLNNIVFWISLGLFIIQLAILIVFVFQRCCKDINNDYISKPIKKNNKQINQRKRGFPLNDVYQQPQQLEEEHIMLEENTDNQPQPQVNIIQDEIYRKQQQQQQQQKQPTNYHQQIEMPLMTQSRGNKKY